MLSLCLLACLASAEGGVQISAERSRRNSFAIGLNLSNAVDIAPRSWSLDKLIQSNGQVSAEHTLNKMKAADMILLSINSGAMSNQQRAALSRRNSRHLVMESPWSWQPKEDYLKARRKTLVKARMEAAWTAAPADKQIHEPYQSKRDVLALTRLVFGPEHPHTVRALFFYIYQLCEIGRQAEALPLIKEALEVRRNVLGPEHPDTLMVLTMYASTLSELGRHLETEPLRKEVLELSRRILGPTHPDALRALSNYAITLDNVGHHIEALLLKRQVLQLRRDGSSTEQPDDNL